MKLCKYCGAGPNDVHDIRVWHPGDSAFDAEEYRERGDIDPPEDDE
jgi:hypothetical protein